MQVPFFSFFVPADEAIAGFNRPCSRSPAQTGHGSVTDKSDVFEMIADDLPVSQIVILFDQASIKRFISTTPDKNQARGLELGKRRDNGSCVDIHKSNRFVTFFVFAVMNTGRVIDKIITMQFEKDFTAGPIDL